jgi:excisionase family DNA binding protein
MAKNKTESKVETRTEEKWVNLADVAEHLSVSQDTIRTWLKDGRLPTVKAGKQYKFRLSEVDRLLEDGKLAE